MIKLTAEEIKFLKNHRQEIINNDFQRMLNDFGNFQRLTEILRSIGIRVPKELVGLKVDDSQDSKNKFIFQSIRFPSLDDIHQLSANLRVYETHNTWNYFTSTLVEDEPNQIYKISDTGEIGTCGCFIKNGYRPILVISNLNRVRPEFKVGDQIILDIGQVGPYGLNDRMVEGEQPWLIINNDEVIYNGTLINWWLNENRSNGYEGSTAQKICEKMLDNIKELN